MQRLCDYSDYKFLIDSDFTGFDYSRLNCLNFHKFVNMCIQIYYINYYYIGIILLELFIKNIKIIKLLKII